MHGFVVLARSCLELTEQPVAVKYQRLEPSVESVHFGLGVGELPLVGIFLDLFVADLPLLICVHECVLVDGCLSDTQAVLDIKHARLALYCPVPVFVYLFNGGVSRVVRLINHSLQVSVGLAQLERLLLKFLLVHTLTQARIL